MRTLAFAAIASAVTIGAAIAAQKLTPKEIQTEFFDGKVTREPQDKSGQKGEGTWKLSKEGFCTTWQSKTATCYTLVNVEKNKWSVVKGATTVAVWSK